MRTFGVALAVWLIAITAGFYWIERHLSQSGSFGKPKNQSRTGQWEFIMAVHPKCPCSRASLRRLRDLRARRGDAIETTILAWQPSDAHWDLPVDVPGAKIVADPEGRLARKAGLETSGHSVLYRPDGTIAFSGGLTPARGSELQSGGLLAIEALLSGRPAIDKLPVFGCALYSRPGTSQ